MAARSATLEESGCAELLKLLGALGAGALVLALVAGAGALYLMHRYGGELPDYRQLADYQPPTVTRVHAGDGRLMAEFAHEKRVFVPVEAIPKRVIQAFLAAEDKNFYAHPGIDPLSIVRAAVTNFTTSMNDRRPVGASTITQQVAKNFLLSNEVTLERKIKEALLAFRIEQAFTKDQILELYLNQIYLGLGSYGVAAAALNYFDKSLDELTVARGGVPRRPAQGAVVVPSRAPARGGQARRDWVIGRMLDVGFIDRSRPSRRAPSRWSCAGARRPRWSPPTTSSRRCAASWSSSTARSSCIRADCRSARRSRRRLQAIAQRRCATG